MTTTFLERERARAKWDVRHTSLPFTRSRTLRSAAEQRRYRRRGGPDDANGAYGPGLVPKSCTHAIREGEIGITAANGSSWRAGPPSGPMAGCRRIAGSAHAGLYLFTQA